MALFPAESIAQQSLKQLHVKLVRSGLDCLTVFDASESRVVYTWILMLEHSWSFFKYLCHSIIGNF